MLSLMSQFIPKKKPKKKIYLKFMKHLNFNKHLNFKKYFNFKKYLVYKTPIMYEYTYAYKKMFLIFIILIVIYLI
jgi:hypothetical protein